jgi:hypothetical protein
LEKANNIFEALLDDFGLCAGIDYGLIYLTIIDARINIVGSPIVYACRMSDYEKNCVVINIKAKTELDNKPNHGIVLKRETIDAKPHEGSLVGYSVKTDISSVDYAEPSWFL